MQPELANPHADLCGNMVFPLKNDGRYTAVVDKK